MPVNSFENYPMSWKPSIKETAKSIYRELAIQLETDIKSGILKPGTMLPPQRELADFLDINLSTVTRAFKLCEQKGLISGAIGRGTFVASDVANNSILLNNNESRLIEMGAVMPGQEPNKMVVGIIQKLLKEPEAYQFFQYGLSDGNRMQKEAAVQWLSRGNYEADPESILFAAGGQNAITGIFASLFQCGDKIGTTAIVYPGIKTAASMLGIKLIPVLEDIGDIDIKSIRQICRKEGVKGLYLIPDYHNPTTQTMKLSARKLIADLANELDLILMEDAINTLLRKEPLPPIASFAPEHTIYIASLSKTLSPGLRTAIVTSPEKYKKELSIGFYNMNIMLSPLLVETAVRLINGPAADEILSQRRDETRRRNRFIDEVLKDFDIRGDSYCNFRWLTLPEAFTGNSFELCARNAGVQIYAAERFAVGNGRIPRAVRIAVTAEASEEEFKKGIYIIKEILESKQEFTYF